MSAKAKWLGGLAVLIVGLGVAFGFGAFGGKSDKELIQVALDEAIQASKEGRPGGVLDFISRRFEVNGEQYATRDISKTIKDMKPDVEISNPEPTISGDTATITSPVRLSVSLPPVGMDLNQVEIHFAKEMGTKWLVFPTKKWRMTKVDIPDDVVNQVRSQFGEPQL